MKSLLLGALLLAAPFAARAQDPEVHYLDHVAWLAGCWENHFENGSYDETWTAPKGGTMLGVSRTVIAGTAIEYEFLRIVEENDQLLFIAKPSGQPEAIFRAAQLGDSLVMFINPEHDFPQRVCYQLEPGGSVLAWIDGTNDGEPRKVEFPMRRAECP